MAVDPKLFRQILSAAGAPTAAATGATPAPGAVATPAPATVAAEARRPTFGQRALGLARSVGRVSGGVQAATGAVQAGAAAAGAPVAGSDVVRNLALGAAGIAAPGIGLGANLLVPLLDSLTEAGLRGVGAIKENKLLTPEFAEEVRAAGGPEAFSRKVRSKPAPAPTAPAPASTAPAAAPKARRDAPKLGTQGDIFTNLVQFTRDFGDFAIGEAGERQQFRRGVASQELELRAAQALASLLAATKPAAPQQKIVEGLTPEESLVVDPSTAIARRLRFAAPAVRGEDGQVYIIQNDGSRRLATPTEVRQLGVN